MAWPLGKLAAAPTDASSKLVSQYDHVYDAAGNRTSRQVVQTLVGEQSVQPSNDTNTIGLAEAFKTTAHASGSAASLTVYLDASSTASSVQIGLYSNSGSHPGSLLGSGTIATPSNGGWNRVTISAPVTKGQSYWIAVLQPTGSAGTIKFRANSSGGSPAETSSSGSLAALPAAWSSGTTFSNGPIAGYLTGAPQTTSYAFNNANQLCWSYTGSSSASCGSPPSGATGFSYDAAGQQLTGDSTFTYDHLTQIRRSTAPPTRSSSSAATSANSGKLLTSTTKTTSSASA